MLALTRAPDRFGSRSINELKSAPLFWAGLGVRVTLILLLEPVIQERWFESFVAMSVAKPALDPWMTYLNAGGTPLAFPYGYVMLVAFMPLVAAGQALDRLLGTSLLAQVNFATTVLIADLLL